MAILYAHIKNTSQNSLGKAQIPHPRLEVAKRLNSVGKTFAQQRIALPLARMRAQAGSPPQSPGCRECIPTPSQVRCAGNPR